MRTLIVLLLLATGFGLAALWQSRHLGELRAQQRQAWEIADGELARTESGTIPEGWGVVVVGAPSGVPPLVVDPPVDSRGASLGELAIEVPDAEGFEPPLLEDLELQVQAGQTLSGIVHAHYGSAAPGLLEALAEYNGIADANALSAGMTLLLPELERLFDEE